MTVPRKHIIHQRRVLASLAQTALSALRQRVSGVSTSTPQTPGPQLTAVIDPPPPDLVRDYVRHVGGDPSAYRGTIPPHLFPQWGFPLAARTLVGVPYPLMNVLNGGCRMEIKAPLPAGQPLHISARLENIDDNGRRAVLHQRIVTGTESEPEALVSHLYAIVPLRKSKGDASANGEPQRKQAPPCVPADAHELSYWRLPADAGLSFALLTGDFNPVHWVPAYAKASGFKSNILHGFATLARAIEGLSRAHFAGSVGRLETIDVKFTKPLVLPARVGLYLAGQTIFVGDAPGGPAYLVGEISTLTNHKNGTEQ